MSEPVIPTHTGFWWYEIEGEHVPLNVSRSVGGFLVLIPWLGSGIHDVTKVPYTCLGPVVPFRDLSKEELEIRERAERGYHTSSRGQAANDVKALLSILDHKLVNRRPLTPAQLVALERAIDTLGKLGGDDPAAYEAQRDLRFALGCAPQVTAAEQLRLLLDTRDDRGPGWMCSNCGNTDGVQWLDWVSVNTGEIIGDSEDMTDDDCWCPNCEGHYKLIEYDEEKAAALAASYKANDEKEIP